MTLLCDFCDSRITEEDPETREINQDVIHLHPEYDDELGDIDPPQLMQALLTGPNGIGPGQDGAEEIRPELVERVERAHAALLVFVEFPREDNEVDTLDSGAAQLLAEDEMSMAETLASYMLISDQLDEISGKFDAFSRDSDGPDGGMGGMAIPIPGQAMGMPQMGGDGGSDKSGLGFQ